MSIQPQTTQKKVDELLRESRDATVPTPPSDLADRIKADIPPHLDVAPEWSEDPKRSGLPMRWLAAASVLVALGAGVVAVQVFQQNPDAIAPETPGQGGVQGSSPEAVLTDNPLSGGSASEAVGSVEVSEVDSSLVSPGESADLANPRPAPRTPSEPVADIEIAPPPPPESLLRAEGKLEESRSLGRVVPAPGRKPKTQAERLQADARADDAAGTVRSRQEPRTTDEISVVSEAPLLDERVVTAGTTVTQQELEKVPTANDPWSTISQAPGVVTKRIDTGGNESDRDSVSAGEASGRNRYKVDGVVITEGRAVGSSPTYYDLESMEEGVLPSTGGTTEPNDRPYGDVFFRDYGTNPFIDAEEDHLSTFGLDVDTGSYAVARRYLSDGNLPPREAIRVEEFVNYFDYRDAPPARGDFRLIAQGADAPFAHADGYQVLRLAVKARELVEERRKPAVLTFVVDVSGSMAREDRLGLVKEALALMLQELGPDDEVGLAVYGSQGRIVLPHTRNKVAIARAIERLSPEGATNAEEGLLVAYQMAGRAFRRGAINRVVLCSDGVANVGRTGPDSILQRIGDAARQGIELSTIGFGMGNYNDELMEQLADRGDGQYAYVDSLDEAERVFVENLTGMLQTVARDAKVQVDFDPDVVERWRLIGYENRDIADHRFRDDTVDAGEIGIGHSATALYEIKLRRGASSRATAGVLRLRYESVDSGRIVEVEEPFTVGAIKGRWSRSDSRLRLATLAAELAELLKGSYWAKSTDPSTLQAEARKLAGESRGDREVAELAEMISSTVGLLPDEAFER